MKIVGIQSSPRGQKSNTLKLLNAALEGAKEAGAEVELMDITKMDIKYCTGCLYCRKSGECIIKDDYPIFLEKVLAADGIILSSPNYLSHVTAQLKTVLDRSVTINHEQQLVGKYAFSIMTAGGIDEELLLNYMNGFLKESGAFVVGGVGHLMNRGPAAMEAATKRAHALGKDLAKAIKEKRAYPDQLKEQGAWREGFARTIKANKESWSHNYEYWVKKGWVRP